MTPNQTQQELEKFNEWWDSYKDRPPKSSIQGYLTRALSQHSVRERYSERLLIEKDVRTIRDKYDITRVEADQVLGRPDDPIDAAEQHDQFEQSKMAITFEHELLELNKARLADLTKLKEG